MPKGDEMSRSMRDWLKEFADSDRQAMQRSSAVAQRDVLDRAANLCERIGALATADSPVRRMTAIDFYRDIAEAAEYLSHETPANMHALHIARDSFVLLAAARMRIMELETQLYTINKRLTRLEI